MHKRLSCLCTVSANGEPTRDSNNLNNLQNLISYSQAQESALKKVADVVDRMGVLATQSLDITKNDQDREMCNKEFQELAKLWTK